MANLTPTSGQTAFLIKLLRVPVKLAFSIPKSRGMNNCMKPIKIKRTKKRRKETFSFPRPKSVLKSILSQKWASEELAQFVITLMIPSSVIKWKYMFWDA